MQSSWRKLSRKSISINRFQSLSTSSWDYDVIVNCGGVVGAAFAADLLNRTKGQCKIAIIEPQKIKDLKTTKSLPDVRVYAMAPQSIAFLKTIGAWEHINERSHPYTNMQIWESNGPGLVKFRADKMNVDELGRICEDATIQSAIYCAIKQSGHQVDFIQSEGIVDILIPEANSFNHEPVKVSLLSTSKTETAPKSRQITARLLVGADGAQSTVRRLTGGSTWGWNYGVEGVVATVSIRDTLPTESDSALANYNNTAWQNYLSTGPLALLPLWDGYASIVWSVPVPLAKKLKSLNDSEFLQELNKALRAIPQTDKWSSFEGGSENNGLHKLFGVFGRELKAVADTAMAAAQLSDSYVCPPEVKHVCSPRMSFPLSFQQAKRYVQPRVALIGDAAHSIHPQAGQGLNLGLADAACLSTTIDQALLTGQDFGLLPVLDKFAKERYVKNLLMMSAVDTINSVFKDEIGGLGCEGSSPNSPLSKGKQLVRSLGMLGVHSLGPIKHEMAKYAMGLK